MMRASRSWKDKLPSIAGTLAMQVAIAALLLFSITTVRRELAQPETILFLPPPRPVTIDARQPPPPREESQRPSAQTVPTPPPPLPAYAAPSASLSASTGGNGALQGALGRHVENCRIEKRNADAQCPPALAHRDERALTLDAGKPVKNASIWQGEANRKKIPSGLPSLMVALNGDGVSLSDPKAHGLDAPILPGMTGAERLQLRRYYTPQTSRGGTDWENRVRWDGAKALGYD